MTPIGAILVATSNAGKLREIRVGLHGVPLRLESLDDYPGLPPAVEDGATFEANARIKALHYSRLRETWALADDSGLEVEALAGQPGVRSARYAGDHATDQDNNRKLIRALEQEGLESPAARFRCALAWAAPSGVVAVTEGTIHGIILRKPRGDNGFGYDPYFFVPQLGKTLAELDSDAKNQISHRGEAVRAMRNVLIQRISTDHF
jgi:XTP/dITP diphosphohydrolase